MNSEQERSLPTENMLVLQGCLDTSLESSPYNNWEGNLDITIKDEPLEIIECSLGEFDIKDEPGEIDICIPIDFETPANESGCGISANDQTNSNLRNENTKNTSVAHTFPPVIRKVVVDGQKRTCLLVNNPELKKSIMQSIEQARKTKLSPPNPIQPRSNTNVSNPIVKCTRCGSDVHLDNFKHHIDACPPRRSNSRQTFLSKGDTGQNQTIQVIQNQSNVEALTFSDYKSETSIQTPNVSARFHSLQTPQSRTNENLSSLGLECAQKSTKTSLNLFHNNDDDFSEIPRLPSVSLNNPPFRQSSDNTHDLNIKSYVMYMCSKCDFKSTTHSAMDIHMQKHNSVTSNIPSRSQKIRNESADTLHSGNSPSQSLSISSIKANELIAPFHRNNSQAKDSPIKRNFENSNVNILSPPTTVVTIWKGEPQKADLMLPSYNGTLIPKTDTEANPVRFNSNTGYRAGTLIAPLNANILDTLSNNTATEQNLKDSNNQLLSTVKKRAIWERVPLEVGNAEEERMNSVHGRGSDAETSLPETENDQNQFESIKKCKGLGRKTPHDTEVENLRGTDLIIESDDYETKSENLANERLTVSRRTTKSVYARKFTEIANEFSSPSTRNNSFSGDTVTDSVSDTSSIITRSRSVCKKIISDQKSKQFQRSLSVPRGNEQSDITEASGSRGKQISSEESHVYAKRKIIAVQNFASEGNSPEKSSCVFSSLTNDVNVGDKGFEVSNRNVLKNSVTNMSGKSNFRSVLNNKIDTTHENHSLAANESNTLACSICSFTTDKKRSLTDHERNHRKTKSIIFWCVYCGEKYTRYMLYLHVKRVHPGQKFVIPDKSKQIKSQMSKKRSVADIRVSKMSTECRFRPVINNVGANREDEYFTVAEDAENILDLLLDDSTFHCSTCSFTTDKKTRLQKHERNHRKTNLPIYPCSYCSQKYTRYMLYLHVKNVHPGQKFQIQEESKEAKSKMGSSSSSSGVPDDNGITNKSIDIRGGSVLDSSNYINNDKSSFVVQSSEKVKDLPLLNENTFTCSICSFTTNKETSLRAHVRNHRERNLPIMSCNYCSERYTRYMLYLHVKNVHPGQKFQIQEESKEAKSKMGSSSSSSGVPDDNCITNKSIDIKGGSVFDSTNSIKSDKCSFIVQSSEKVKDLPLLNENTFPCSICSFTTNKETSLREHERNHRERNLPIMSCNYCSERYTRNMLYLHVRNFHPGQKFQIQESEEAKSKMVSRGSSGISDDNGISNKSNDSKYGSVFNSTNYTRSDKSSIIQSSEKVKDLPLLNGNSFPCSLCSFTTNKIKNLKEHERNHQKTNSPIISCNYCSERYTRNSLFSHLKKIHPRETFQLRNAALLKAKSKTNNSRKLNSNIKNHVFKTMKLNVVKAKFATTNLEYSKLQMEKLPSDFVKCTDASGLQRYECQLCSYRCLYLSVMNDHINTHTNNPLIKQCPTCDFRSTPNALSCHMKRCRKKPKGVTKSSLINRDQIDTYSGSFKGTSAQDYVLSPKFLKCKICSYRTTHSNHFAKHTIAHKSHSPIKKCPNCNFKSTPKALMYHIRKCSGTSGSHKIKIDQKKSISVKTKTKVLFKCDKCSYFTSLRIKLKLHKRKSHVNTRSGSKTISDFPIINYCPREDLEHQNERPAVIEEKFKCKYCSFVTSKIPYHRLHMECHAIGAKMRKCSSCSFKSTRSAVRKHRLEAGHKEKIYKCKSCSFNTSQYQIYICHMKTHKTNKNPQQNKERTKKKKAIKNITPQVVKCKFCSFVCARPGHLKSHMTSHELNLPIKKCPFCKFTSTRGPLARHIHKCKNKEVANCSNNGTTMVVKFKDSEKLETNKKSQSSTEKSIFQCPLCSFSTYLRIKLNFHKKKYHEQLNIQHISKVRQLYQCKICSYSSYQRTNLIRHMNTHLIWKLPIVKCENCEYRSTRMALKAHLIECNKNSINQSKLEESFIATRKKNNEVTKSRKENEVDNLQRRIPSGEEGLSKNSSGFFSCTVCSFTSQKKSTVRKHILNHRWNVTKQCKNCNYRATPKALSLHLSRCIRTKKASKKIRTKMESPGKKEIELTHVRHVAQQNVTNDTSPKSFKCQYCSFSSFWDYLIERHMYSHTSLELPIKQCEDCDFRSTPAALLAHKNNECTAKPLGDNSNTRQLVSSKTDVAKNVSGQERRESPNSNGSPKTVFSCPKCSFSTNLRIKLKYHMKTNHLLKRRRR